MIDYTKYKLKPVEEIREIFNQIDGSVFILICKKCYKEFSTNTELEKENLYNSLTEENKHKIVECIDIDFLCNNYHTKKAITDLSTKIIDFIKDSGAIGVISCGLGIQLVASLFEDKKVLALADSVPESGNSTSPQGYHGIALGKEKCGTCGQCYLNRTGGICPVVNCSKSLLNGPCGGAKNGKCEVNPDIPCAWEEIYFRLNKQNRPLLNEIQVRNFNIFPFKNKKEISEINLYSRGKDFLRGIHPLDKKNLTENSKIKTFPEPETVIIFLSQHAGAPAIPVVKVGDKVKIGQKIGEISGFISSPIHSSISGTITAIEEKTHPTLGRKMPAIIIKNDNKNEFDDSIKAVSLDNIPGEKVIEVLREKGIVGMGGAMFPTYVKLFSKKPIDTLIINGCECEPYLNGDNRLMIEYGDKIFKGIEIVKKTIGVQSVIIGIEENKPEAIESMKKQILGNDYIKISILKTKYPQGAEKILIKSILNRQIPEGGLPLDVGVVVLNISTLYAIYRAIYEGMPVIDRVITISGDYVKNPGNYLIKIGTPIKSIIDFTCGSDFIKSDDKNKKIFMGGPMMGILQMDIDTGLIKGTTGLTIMESYPVESSEERECIKCGRCVDVCPVDLFPLQYYYYGKKQDWQKTAEYKVKNCIECAACQYICSAKIDILKYIKKAKKYAYNKT
jgi:electron transport complex protein RnfC